MMQDPKLQHQEPTAEPAGAETGRPPAAPEAGEPAAPSEAAEAPAAEDPLAVLQAEIASLQDRLARALAEVENVRRQKDRELEELRKYAITNFARGLLEVADNLRRALAAVDGPAEGRDPLLQTLLTGVEMTERTLLALFEKHQIRKVHPERGEHFDPTRHQAMFEVATDELPPGSIAEVLQPGYVLADRLLRPALVGVAKAAAPSERPSSNGGSTVDERV